MVLVRWQQQHRVAQVAPSPHLWPGLTRHRRAAPLATEGKSPEYLAACLEKNLKRIARAKVPHAKRVKLYDRNERAYKGIIEGVRSGRWNHCVHPPYIFEVIETMESGLVDDAVQINILPNKPNMADGAEALERLIEQQSREARLDEEKGHFTKNALVYGIAVLKTQWLYQRGAQTRRTWDAAGTELEPITETVTHFEGPVSNNIDPRDFLWDPTATNLDNAEYVIFKYWASRAEVKRNGTPDEGGDTLWMNVDELLTSSNGRDSGTLDNPSLDKSKPEVEHGGEFLIWEVWTRDGLVVIGNEAVLLQDDPSPFWHNELPFQIGYTLSDLNRFEGQSEVTALIDLQNALWDIQNQTLDNVELANNGVFLVSADVDDMDQFNDLWPGKRLIVDEPERDFKMLETNTRLLNASQGIVSSLKGDLQTIAAALPYLSGASDGIDQDTAKGVSIIANMAQRRLLRKKGLLGYAYNRCGHQWIALNQQFMTVPRAVRIDGPTGSDFKNVSPQEIQGDYDFSIEYAPMAADQAQNQSNAMTLLQVLMPYADAVGLDKKALVENTLIAFREPNPDKYFVPEAERQQIQLQGGQVQTGLPQEQAAPPFPAPPAQ